jgi:hypothetical protein
MTEEAKSNTGKITAIVLTLVAIALAVTLKAIQENNYEEQQRRSQFDPCIGIDPRDGEPFPHPCIDADGTVHR